VINAWLYKFNSRAELLVVSGFVLVAAEQFLSPFLHGVDRASCLSFGCAFCDVAGPKLRQADPRASTQSQKVSARPYVTYPAP
jgi:hypothetical protein